MFEAFADQFQHSVCVQHHLTVISGKFGKKSRQGHGDRLD